jgi:hypothetical protein
MAGLFKKLFKRSGERAGRITGRRAGALTDEEIEAINEEEMKMRKRSKIQSSIFSRLKNGLAKTRNI